MGKRVIYLLKKIQERMNTFSKGQKRIANYLSSNLHEAAYMTAARLGETVGVSESTVVRFATELGYEGYPAMQKALQEIIKSKLTSVQRMKVSNAKIDPDNVLKSVLTADMYKLKVTIEDLDTKEFDAVVDELLKAKRIYILGVRSSSTLAGFLGFYFNLMFNNIRLIHTTSVSEMFEQILNIEEGDAVIGISFPRYSTRTLKAMEYAKSRGAKTIAITDSREASIAIASDYAIVAESDMLSFVDSLVAPLSVINALIVALYFKRSDEISENFERLEKIWDTYNVYEKYDETGSNNTGEYE